MIFLLFRSSLYHRLLSSAREQLIDLKSLKQLLPCLVLFFIILFPLLSIPLVTAIRRLLSCQIALFCCLIFIISEKEEYFSLPSPKKMTVIWIHNCLRNAVSYLSANLHGHRQLIQVRRFIVLLSNSNDADTFKRGVANIFSFNISPLVFV